MNDENEYPGVSIILYDRTGEIVQYDNIDTISTNVPDGKDKAVFSYGTVLEDVQVPLNFSEGNQLVKVQYGQLVREATILRPENFIPENIKKGEEIAGLIGTFAGDETEKIVDLDFRDYIYINDEESMLTLLNEENNIGLCIKYIGEDGRYENGKYYQIVESYDNFSAESCFESTAETNADTTLTSEIECYIGDLIIAAFVTRSNLVSIGDNNWTIISFSESTLEHDNTCSVDQRLYFAYKFAESTTETITVTQESEDAIYINMVSFSDGIDFIDTGYQYASGGSSATFDRPTNEIILWGITKSLWSTSNPVWSVSNDSKLIQLGDTTASILLLAVDNSKDATVKFTSGVSTTPDVYICGTLSIILKPFVFKEISEDKLTISDKQIVNADEGTVLTKVTINKPEGLESNNIRKGVTIGEIDGGIDVQKLNAPTITATASGVYNNLTIVNPSNNGNFADTLN
ncbi:MAG: hypothetical protein IJZ77_03075, partial [Bacilli bacterium]|nr:hypothetical protein [Bacilli bacterium]